MNDTLVDRLHQINAELRCDEYEDERYVDTADGEFDNSLWLLAERREVLRELGGS